MKYLLFLLLISCAHIPKPTPKPIKWAVTPITWTYSYGFPEKNKWAFREGFEYWNKVVGQELFHELKCEDQCVLQFPNVLIFEGVTLEPTTAFAQTDLIFKDNIIKAGTIKYYPNFDTLSYEVQVSVTRHEVGHLLGLLHDEKNSACLMFPLLFDFEEYKQPCGNELAKIRLIYSRLQQVDP